MSHILSSIGSFFTKDIEPAFSKANLGTTLSGINVGMGEIGNLLAGGQQAKLASDITNQEKAFESLTPAQLTAKIQSAEAPINQGLIQGINNNVQADLASRGLAQAPGIFASEEAQAIAPILQNNYNTALSQVMAQYNIPLQYASVLQKLIPPGQNMTPAMQLFLQQLGKRFPGGGGFPTTGPNPSLGANPPFGGGTPPIFGDTGTTPDLSGIFNS